MALTVGTDSYISEAAASTYCALAGLTALADAQNSLKRATLAIDRLYGGRFIGIKSTVEQQLQWPRRPREISWSVDEEYFTDSFGNVRTFNGIPKEIEQATVELAALIEAGTDLYAQPEPRVTAETVEVDVIKTSKTFAGGGYQPRALSKVELILAPVLMSAATVRLVR